MVADNNDVGLALLFGATSHEMYPLDNPELLVVGEVEEILPAAGILVQAGLALLNADETALQLTADGQAIKDRIEKKMIEVQSKLE